MQNKIRNKFVKYESVKMITHFHEHICSFRVMIYTDHMISKQFESIISHGSAGSQYALMNYYDAKQYAKVKIKQLIKYVRRPINF